MSVSKTCTGWAHGHVLGKRRPILPGEGRRMYKYGRIKKEKRKTEKKRKEREREGEKRKKAGREKGGKEGRTAKWGRF